MQTVELILISQTVLCFVHVTQIFKIKALLCYCLTLSKSACHPIETTTTAKLVRGTVEINTQHWFTPKKENKSNTSTLGTQILRESHYS